MRIRRALEENFFLRSGKQRRFMSKLAKIPIDIKEGVNISFENDHIKVGGPKGSLIFKIPEGVKVEVVNNRLQVGLHDKKTEGMQALLGLTRAKIANMVAGVYGEFTKKLELSGVGYRVQLSGNDLVLTLGFTHPIIVRAVGGITFKVSENVITVSGIDKDLVGDLAARIRGIHPPDPYKGKGIRYVGERIRRKVGKAAKAVGSVGSVGAK